MHARAAALLSCLLLAACGNGDDAERKATAGAEALPAPGAVSGSVTGMPNPGEATVVPAATPEPAAVADPLAVEDPPEQPDASAAEPPPEQPGPGPDAAVAVLRDYFAAINAQDFARAQAAWRNAPQGTEAFAQGFADVAGMSVEIGAPAAYEAMAGQRSVELPVRLEITRIDGRQERQAGSYTLQRGAPDGGDGQWRIVRSSFGPR